MARNSEPIAGLTMRELLEIPQIDITVIAGKAGLDRPVRWAYASEMAQPWDWGGQDELLMTIGHCVPPDPAGQVEFVQSLASAGLAGLAIWDGEPAPPLSPTMLASADELAFPILQTGDGTPYSVIARAVATANDHAELHRFWQLSRLNAAMVQSARGKRGSLLQRISDELGYPVFVIDARHGTEILTAIDPLDDRVGRAVADRVALHLKRLPARLHLDLGDWTGTCFPLPSERPAMLVVPDSGERRIDPFAVLHVAGLLAVEVERLTVEREHTQRDARDLFGQLLNGCLDSDSASRQLRRFAIEHPPFVVAALPGDQLDASYLLSDRRLAHLAAADGGDLLLLLEFTGLCDAIAALGATSTIGTSAPIHSVPHVPDAVREAHWALQTAESQGGGHVDYAAARPLFLPRTVTEAQNAATAVLGKVVDYDLKHGSELISSLHVYLNCDRSWKRAAEVLGVHRQTLGSRLAKIEGLTGRDLHRTKDIAECWMALRALDTVVRR